MTPSKRRRRRGTRSGTTRNLAFPRRACLATPGVAYRRPERPAVPLTTSKSPCPKGRRPFRTDRFRCQQRAGRTNPTLATITWDLTKGRPRCGQGDLNPLAI